MLNLNDLVFFVAAVEHGGFAPASRRLGLPKSTLSKRVAELEEALQVRLIHRTSRSFTLTDVGRDFYEHARASIIEAEAAQDIVRQRVAEPSGTVRITASVPVAQEQLAAHLPRLAQRFPRLCLQLDVTDRFVDVVQEGYDIAVRSHFAPLPDSGLVQRRIGQESIVLVASPGYLDAHGMPTDPEALERHDGLLSGAGATRWTLMAGAADARTVEVTPRPRMIANESQALRAAAGAGLGIACLPESLCRPDLDEGRLSRVFPGWHAGRVTTTLVMPHRRGQLPGVRAVVDFLIESLGHD
ncbi:LysR substrate-binding domain-containing protein [Pseudoxanthomonas beigongshangi]|uniref:LysR substrate-binding domain-containing protein n=1 Tax=Pseudoxanthomonas beigongshangi TaxID=2782537 RepID=UPI00193C8677|nr:LysR substrate-binding domain-containing protein [Pseudoxanthomonas beigongshangi]